MGSVKDEGRLWDALTVAVTLERGALYLVAKALDAKGTELEVGPRAVWERKTVPG